jgi:hypothetical protein
MNNENFEWQVGDIGEAFGVRGVVVGINCMGSYPICVRFENGRYIYFTKDSKWYDWHKKPSLIFIERPKKKVRKVIEVKRWINVYDDNSAENFYMTEEEADRWVFLNKNRIACIELKGSYEIEVEE